MFESILVELMDQTVPQEVLMAFLPLLTCIVLPLFSVIDFDVDFLMFLNSEELSPC